MIRGMVAGLAERLATEGGTPEEWARLIRAYGVLGDLDKAALVWTEAKQTFADNPEAMALLRAEAQELGID
jgi:cytochrome c-type biogenesis protein CcmH